MGPGLTYRERHGAQGLARGRKVVERGGARLRGEVRADRQRRLAGRAAAGGGGDGHRHAEVQLVDVVGADEAGDRVSPPVAPGICMKARLPGPAVPPLEESRACVGRRRGAPGVVVEVERYGGVAVSHEVERDQDGGPHAHRRRERGRAHPRRHGGVARVVGRRGRARAAEGLSREGDLPLRQTAEGEDRARPGLHREGAGHGPVADGRHLDAGPVGRRVGDRERRRPDELRGVGRRTLGGAASAERHACDRERRREGDDARA